jgi:hypothetical protein
VVKYLVTWLRETDYEEETNGWKLEMGFRRGFCIHQVWHHIITGRYAFYVHETDDWDKEDERADGVTIFNSFMQLLAGVADRHAECWHLAR